VPDGTVVLEGVLVVVSTSAIGDRGREDEGQILQEPREEPEVAEGMSLTGPRETESEDCTQTEDRRLTSTTIGTRTSSWFPASPIWLAATWGDPEGEADPDP